MLYIFWGEDDFSIEESLRELKMTLGNETILSSNTSVLEGQKIKLNELKLIGEALPFLSEKRLVIIKGLLQRFDNKESGTRSRRAGESSHKQEEVQSLADCILGFPQSTVLVLIDIIEGKNFNLKNNPLYVALSPAAIVRAFPVLRDTGLSQWIQSRVNSRGGSISHQATTLLMELIGGNLHIMSNEIDKLIAFTEGRKIEEKDVRQVVSAAREADIFAMVDAILDHKTGMAEQMLQELLQHGLNPSQILVMVARQVQLMVQLKDMRAQKKPLSEIRSKLGIFHENIWKKIYQRSDKYTLERLKQIYRYLLQTDLAIKTGKLEGDLALSYLTASLSAN